MNETVKSDVSFVLVLEQVLDMAPELVVDMVVVPIIFIHRFTVETPR